MNINYNQLKTTSSQDFLLPKMLTQTLDQLSEPYIIKDLKSRFIYANQAVAKLFSLRAPDDMLFKQEYEFNSPLTENESIVDAWQAQDRKITLDMKPLVMLEIHPKAIEKPYIIRKLPFYNDNDQCVGVVMYSRSIENFNLNKFIKINAPSSLLLNKPDEFFTEQECEFIFLKLQRMSNKDIANTLQIASATVDQQIGQLYEKCGVTHPDDFIEFCERRNYHRYLPESFLQQKGNVFKKNNNFII